MRAKIFHPENDVQYMHNSNENFARWYNNFLYHKFSENQEIPLISILVDVILFDFNKVKHFPTTDSND